MPSLSSASLGRENSCTLFLAEREPLNLFHAADQMFGFDHRVGHFRPSGMSTESL
jgi:hypothetical protein